MRRRSSAPPVLRLKSLRDIKLDAGGYDPRPPSRRAVSCNRICTSAAPVGSGDLADSGSAERARLTRQLGNLSSTSTRARPLGLP
ncbi:hypothetical protein THAOC_05611, partial [Thalassiosira oceanica]